MILLLITAFTLIVGWAIFKAKKFRDINNKIYRDEIRRMREQNEKD